MQVLPKERDKQTRTTQKYLGRKKIFKQKFMRP